MSSNGLTGGYWFIGFPQLKKLNVSYNKYTKLNISNAQLIDLDCSNNLIDTLGLRGSNNLVRINCSNNFVTDLFLDTLPNLNYFNCLGANLIRTGSSLSPTCPTPTCPTSTCPTSTTTEINTLTLELAIPLGMSVLG